MVDKHWTTELAEKAFDSGYKYAIMRHTPNCVGTDKKPEMIGFNDISEFYSKIEELGCVGYDMFRLALRPSIDRYAVVYYRENGAYWVVAYILERPSDYKVPDLSKMGIVKI